MLVLLFWAAAAVPGSAEEIIADVSDPMVAITTDFNGSEIFIYGAVSRDVPLDELDGQLDIVVQVTGPAAPITVRRKERVLGIWVNRSAEMFEDAPHYIAVASNTADVLENETVLRALGIGYRSLIAPDGADAPVVEEEFLAALIRIRERQSLFQLLPRAVNLRGETLFDVRFTLPANLVEGDYGVEIVLLREGVFLDRVETAVAVRRAGLERCLMFGLPCPQIW